MVMSMTFNLPVTYSTTPSLHALAAFPTNCPPRLCPIKWMSVKLTPRVFSQSMNPPTVGAPAKTFLHEAKYPSNAPKDQSTVIMFTSMTLRKAVMEYNIKTYGYTIHHWWDIFRMFVVGHNIITNFYLHGRSTSDYILDPETMSG